MNHIKVKFAVNVRCLKIVYLKLTDMELLRLQKKNSEIKPNVIAEVTFKGSEIAQTSRKNMSERLSCGGTLCGYELNGVCTLARLVENQAERGGFGPNHEWTQEAWDEFLASIVNASAGCKDRLNGGTQLSDALRYAHGRVKIIDDDSGFLYNR